MRILGLDFGTKRIGMSVSDPTGLFAQGLSTIQRGSLEGDLKKIANAVREYSVEVIVIGMPRNMNGTYGESSKMVIDFADKLKGLLDIEIKLWDERLTTVAAEKILLEADLSREKRKKVIDKTAAIIILQNYLDYLSFQKN